MGQAGFVFKSPKGKLVAVDPYLSDSAEEKSGEGYRRMIPPPVAPSELWAHVIACTHDHLDHLDEATILPMRSKQGVTFLGPRNVCRHLRRMGIEEGQIVLLEAGEEVEVEGIKFTGIFALATDEGSIDGEGLLVTFENGIKAYVTGDTSYSELLWYVGKLRPDLMFVCINGRMGNLNPDEAARLARVVQPEVAVPMHYGMFPANDRDPAEFEEALAREGAKAQCLILKTGEFYQYRRKTIERIEHVAIFVSDMERADRFYGEILGLELVARRQFGTTKVAFYRAGDSLLELIARAEPPKEPISEGLGTRHICFRVPDVWVAYERLRAAGVELPEPEAWADVKTVFLKDYDGTTIELWEGPSPND